MTKRDGTPFTQRDALQLAALFHDMKRRWDVEGEPLYPDELSQMAMEQPLLYLQLHDAEPRR